MPGRARENSFGPAARLDDPAGTPRRPAATLRVYGPLNDFLPPGARQQEVVRPIADQQTVKDFAEGAGVPHPEVDLILINGISAGFDKTMADGDHVSLFPRFTTIDVASLTRLRPAPPDPWRFVADVHLGALARRLRLLGIDTMYDPAIDDPELAARARRDNRVLLTRDVGLLKRGMVVHGYYVRETQPHAQLVEVLRRFDPVNVDPFSRCPRCNGILRERTAADVAARLPQRTREHYTEFRECEQCGRLYWTGAHWARLTCGVERALEEAATGVAGRA